VKSYNPENPDSKPMRQYPSANKLYFQTSDVIINPENPVNPDSKPRSQNPSTNKLYFQTSDVIFHPKNLVNPGSNKYGRKM
jgi:hypothetical protein